MGGIDTDNEEGSQDDVTSIVIVYWPQYLQWAGMGLLGVVILGLGLGWIQSAWMTH